MLKDKPTTIVSLARELNVSTATVSRALAGKPGRKAEQICELARQRKFSPNQAARSLRQASTRTIGVLVTRDIAVRWYSQLVCKLEEHLTAHGKVMQLSISRHDPARERQCLEAFHNNRVDGVIAGPVFRKEDLTQLREFTETTGIPLVCFSCMDDLPANYVTVDYREGARQAVDLLIRNGHRDIVYLGCPESDLLEIAGTRRQGFAQALFEHDLPLYKYSIIPAKTTSRRMGWEAVRELLSSKHRLPTAFFCHNDEIALGAMFALQQNGVRIPEDVSFIGFDNQPECEMSFPPLTTVAGEIDRLAGRLVEFAVAEPASDGGFRKERLIPKLIERDSVQKR